jgi:hypothetical protein
MPALQGVDSFAHRVASAAGGGLYDTVFGTPTFDTGTVYEGGLASMLIDSPGNEGVRNLITGTPTRGFVAFALRFSAFPTGADTRLLTISSLGDLAECFLYINTIGQLYINVGPNFSPNAAALSLDTWYWIEVIFDVSTTTYTATWRINEASQTGVNSGVLASASTIDYAQLLSFSGEGTMTWRCGGWTWGSASSGTDWLGKRKFRTMTANGRGTDNVDANPSQHFFENAGADGAITPTDGSYNRLNDGPLDAGTDYLLVKPRSGPTEPTVTWYVEYNLTDAAAGAPDIVRCVFRGLNSAAGVSALGVKLQEGGSEATVFSGDLGSTSSVYKSASFASKPSGGAWTKNAMDALTFRWGYTADATPNPQIHNMWVDMLVPMSTFLVPAGVVHTRAFGTAVLVRVSQTAVPTADSVDGSWTDQAGATSLFAAIDETTPADADYIRSPVGPSNSGCRVKLGTVTDPGVSGFHEIHWRVGKDFTGGPQINMTVKLYQGGGDSQGAGTLIATFSRNNVAAFATFVETLSGAEADAITNYADLYLEFFANQV